MPWKVSTAFAVRVMPVQVYTDQARSGWHPGQTPVTLKKFLIEHSSSNIPQLNIPHRTFPIERSVRLP